MTGHDHTNTHTHTCTHATEDATEATRRTQRGSEGHWGQRTRGHITEASACSAISNGFSSQNRA